MRILITGHAGFIGSNLVRFILQHRPDWHIIGVDALRYSANPDNLRDLQDNPRCSFIHGDVCDLPLMTSLCARAHACIHLAAESHVDRSIADPSPFIHSNAVGTQRALHAWHQTHPASGRFLCVSTDEVYGSLPLDRPDLRFTEDAPLQPSSLYAASKAAADLFALAYHRTHGTDVVITRCSNNFGPYQFPEKIIPLFVTNLLQDRPVPLYGDGLHVRDWIHVLDHCQALLALLEHGTPGRIYNIGARNEHSNLHLTRLLLDILGKDHALIRHVDDRPGHDRRYAIDPSRIERELGWKPTRSDWPDALERTVRWYVDNPHWWQPLRRRLNLD